MKTKTISILCLFILLLVFGTAYGKEIYNAHNLNLDVSLVGAVGGFNSERSYAGFTLTGAGAQSWFEGYGIYGISGEYRTKNFGTIFGAFKLFSGASQGDPNAVGASVGDEYQTEIENGYLGWRSGDTIPWLGHDGFSISVGRQNFVLGSGFLIDNDVIDLGKGLTPGFERGGGAYFLAGRASFGNAVIVTIGQKTGPSARFFWLRSSNKYQAEETLAGVNLEYVNAHYWMLGATYLRGLHVSRFAADIMGNGYREGQNVWAVYGNTSLGIRQLQLAGEYVREAKGQHRTTNISSGAAHAWYTSIGWTFDKVAWSPALLYRFSRFSRHYDPMFYGFGNNLETWFQGQVASLFSGPFNTASNYQLAQVTITPVKPVQVTLAYVNVNGTPHNNLNGNEVDLFAWWTVTKWLQVVPFIGVYNPKKSFVDGGSQLGGSGANVFTFLALFFSF